MQPRRAGPQPDRRLLAPHRSRPGDPTPDKSAGCLTSEISRPDCEHPPPDTKCKALVCDLHLYQVTGFLPSSEGRAPEFLGVAVARRRIRAAIGWTDRRYGGNSVHLYALGSSGPGVGAHGDQCSTKECQVIPSIHTETSCIAVDGRRLGGPGGRGHELSALPTKSAGFFRDGRKFRCCFRLTRGFEGP